MRLVASLIGNNVKRHGHIFSNTWLFELLGFVDAVDVTLVMECAVQVDVSIPDLLSPV